MRKVKGTPVHAHGWWFAILDEEIHIGESQWLVLQEFAGEAVSSKSMVRPEQFTEASLREAFSGCFGSSSTDVPLAIVFSRVPSNGPPEEEYAVVLERRGESLGLVVPASINASTARELAVAFLSRLLR